MNTAQRYRLKQYEQNPEAMDAYARQYGLDAATLDKHLQVMSEIADGELSPKSREWLQQRAAAAGVDQATASKLIKQVLSQPTAQARAAAYINSAGQGNVDPRLAEQAMSLHREYTKQSAALEASERLEQRDRHLQKNGLQYGFEDRDQFKADRQEAAEGVRGAIERAMVSSGLAAPKARTLEEHQARAQLYADQVADRLAARDPSQQMSLRESVEDAYLTADALNKKIDAGLAPEPETLGGVIERAERDAGQWQSLTEDS